MPIERPVTDTVAGRTYGVIPALGQEIHVDRGETFENELFDLSTGNSVFLRVSGANSVIRNVGFKGLYSGEGFLISIDAGPGDVRFENVYMGDGATKGGATKGGATKGGATKGGATKGGATKGGTTKGGASSVHGPGAVYLRHDNEADVTFRRCNVQGFPNNGFHCSNTAVGSSSVHFERCFGKNNGVATFRCAGGNDLLEHCVAYTDTTDYGHDDEDYLETNGRPVWVCNGGTVTIRDSHFADGPYPHALVAGENDAPGRISFESGGYRGTIQRATGSTVDVGPDVSNDPDLSIPASVPTTAAAAASTASNRADGDGDGRFLHVIVFDGSDADGPSYYAFQATRAVLAPQHDVPIDDDDFVLDQPVRGFVGDERRAYRFEGNVEALSVSGDATVSIRYNVFDRTERGPTLQW